MDTTPSDSAYRAATLDDVLAELQRSNRLLERLESDQYRSRLQLQSGPRARPTFVSVFLPVSCAIAFGVPFVWFGLLCMLAALLGGTAAVAVMTEAVLRFLRGGL